MADKVITILSLVSGTGLIALVFYYFYRVEELREKIEKIENEAEDAKKVNSNLRLDELVDRSNESRGIATSGEDPK